MFKFIFFETNEVSAVLILDAVLVTDEEEEDGESETVD